MSATDRATNLSPALDGGDDGFTHKWAECHSVNEQGEDTVAALHWKQRQSANGRTVLDRESVVACGELAEAVDYDLYEVPQVRDRPCGEQKSVQFIREALNALGYPQESVDEKARSVSNAFASSMKTKGRGDAFEDMDNADAIPPFLRDYTEGNVGKLWPDMIEYIETRRSTLTEMTGALYAALKDHDAPLRVDLAEYVEYLDSRFLNMSCTDTALAEAIKMSDHVGDPCAAFEALVMHIKESKGAIEGSWSVHEGLKSGELAYSDLYLCPR